MRKIHDARGLVDDHDTERREGVDGPEFQATHNDHTTRHTTAIRVTARHQRSLASGRQADHPPGAVDDARARDLLVALVILGVTVSGKITS